MEFMAVALPILKELNVKSPQYQSHRASAWLGFVS